MTMNQIARAIDIGFGNVKYTAGEDSATGEIKCGIFPSVAPTVSQKDSGTIGSQRDSVIVSAGDSHYEVGPDSMLSMSTSAARRMDIDFPMSSQYLALARGALHYMQVPEIDCLVVGLPVSSFDTLSEPLRDRMLGVHPLAGREVRVKECVVVPQPVGGLWDFALRNQALPEFLESTCLVVDPGWFTLDWLMTENLKAMRDRTSAANNAGMGAVVRAVGALMTAQISRRDGRPCELNELVMQRVDKAMSGSRIARINGKPERLEPYLEAGMEVMRAGMQRLMGSIGSRADIDYVIVVGGAAETYAPAVCEVFGPEMVRISQNPVFANVRGFQIVATKHANETASAA